MANQRKLGRTADQRKALLRNQVTNLIWNGRITTTEAKAKEVRRIADKMITLAVRECENTVSTTKETHNDSSKITTDGDCSHEIKRCLLLGRKVMTDLDSILKSRDITLLTRMDEPPVYLLWRQPHRRVAAFGRDKR